MRRATVLAAALLAAAGCSEPSGEVATRALLSRTGSRLDPPAAAQALAPNLAVVDGSVAVTWLEPVAAGSAAPGDRSGHRLRFSRHSERGWLAPVTIAEGGDFFANWADLPAVVEMGNGQLLAHWLAKTGSDTYAYSIFLAHSADGGESWRALGQLNADVTPTEHGFVSWIAEGNGARAFWLDGRGMADGEPMAIRTAHVGGVIGPEEVLDERTCECCSTDAALTAAGPVVVYRDRSVGEIRDIGRVRRDGDSWSSPAIVHADDWQIEGCPVNGPEIAARGERVVVAWFTASPAIEGTSESSPGAAVKVAFSADSAASFENPVIVDASTPLGRVDVALDDEGDAWVVWMRQAGDVAEVRLQGLSSDGERGQGVLIATTSAARASGFPRLAHIDGSLYVSWVEIGGSEPSRIRLQQFSLS